MLVVVVRVRHAVAHVSRLAWCFPSKVAVEVAGCCNEVNSVFVEYGGMNRFKQTFR